MSFAISNNTLSSNASPAQIANYLTSNRGGILAEQLLAVVAGALVLWFVATLARVLHARDEHSPLGLIVLAAGAGMAVILSLDGLPLTALEGQGNRPGYADTQVTRVPQMSQRSLADRLTMLAVL